MIPTKEELLLLLTSAQQGPVPSEQIRWLAPLIDHTLLKPGATEAHLAQLCREAREFHFATVCVEPGNVAFCVRELRGSGVKTIAVAGFPSGTVSTEEKLRDVRAALSAGAVEIDVVLNTALVKEKKLREAFEDLRAVVEECGMIPVKVILETCLLSRDERLMASALAKAAGAAFLKTSTGFSTGGATTEDIELLRWVAGEEMGVKASGGVRNLVDALKMVLAGANRIGTSGGVAIVGGKTPQSGQSGVY